jgi:hypothetical protein
MTAVNDVFNAESLFFCIIILSDDPSDTSFTIIRPVATRLLHSDTITDIEHTTVGACLELQGGLE